MKKLLIIFFIIIAIIGQTQFKYPQNPKTIEANITIINQKQYYKGHLIVAEIEDNRLHALLVIDTVYNKRTHRKDSVVRSWIDVNEIQR